jgi:type IV secretory pathway component VirB8
MANIKMDSPATAADKDLNTRLLMASVTTKLGKISLLTSGAALCMAITMVLVMPLKQSVPYVVQVNKDTGEVSVPKNQSVGAFEPGWANTEFFIRRWITDLFTTNQYLTVNIGDPRAQSLLRGNNAITEYKAFRAQDQTFENLVADPSLVRDVKILTLTPVAGTKNGVVAQIALTTRRKGAVTTVTKLVTIYYIFIHSDDVETVRQNPIGIYITDFKLSDA